MAHISGVGMVTPVGLSAPASCAALRAGLSGLVEIPSYLVPGPQFDREPLVGGRVPTEWFQGGPIEEEWPGHERFELPEPPSVEEYVPAGAERLGDLAAMAAREAWVRSSTPASRLGVYLGLGESEPGESVMEAVVAAIGAHPTETCSFAQGRAAGLDALNRAMDDLGGGVVDMALVGGVDSLVRAPVLERLEAEGRLRSAAVPEGVIPGESAAFVVLSAAQTHEHGLGVLDTSLGQEGTVETKEPNQAAALTAVLTALDARWGFFEPTLVVCDLNGDRYRATEWAMASMRVLSGLQGDIPLWHPADAIGDCGAGSGMVCLAWSFTAMAAGYAPARRALVWGASDGPLRAAALVGLQSAGRQ